jgi:hypothetical protein
MAKEASAQQLVRVQLQVEDELRGECFGRGRGRGTDRVSCPRQLLVEEELFRVEQGQWHTCGVVEMGKCLEMGPFLASHVRI